jgi:Transposase zinc-binding domain
MPAIEVADMFDRHGESYRCTHAGHLSRTERHVIGAIQACRTAALGGHVERCTECGRVWISYNSCR